MSWQIPTADDVLSEFTPTENAAISTLMGSGSLDSTAKLSAVLTRVIAEVRAYIMSGDYALDDDPLTIPLGLFNDAIAIARWRFLVSVPALKQLQTDERKDAYKDALTKLALIAKGEFAVEPPVPPTTPLNGNWNSEQKLIMRTHADYANADAPADT